ncbi:MAG: hypothetical protein ACTSXH_09800 [Promethearchaeota archaeon]
MNGIRNSLENIADFEIEQYDRIIDFFREQEQNPSKKALLMGKAFVELMALSDKSEYKEFVKNGLILIKALFEDDVPDIYHSKGCSLDQLCTEEKCMVLNILKEEFQETFL